MAKPVEIEILLKDRLSAGLESARRELERLAAGGDTSSERVRRLQTEIRGLEAELARLNEAGENTRVLPPELPQAQRQFNGLHMSIQQIAREMPSLAMGPQMFFMAISNNLPVFTDELARARKEYQTLVATGGKATPVWRQVLSSLFSWQTALTTGIMLLVMYSKEIGDWAGNLFKAKDGAGELEKAMKRLNETVSAVEGSVSEEMSDLRELNNRLKETKRGTEEWNQIRNKIVTGYSQYLPSIDREIDKTGSLADSYDRLAESIRKAAAVRGFEKAKSKEDEEYIKKREETLKKVYEAFIDDYGKEGGYDMYRKWLAQLDSGMEGDRKTQNLFARTKIGWFGSANSLLIELQRMEKAREEELDAYRKIFGLTESVEDGLPSDSIKALRDSISARREALEQLSSSSEEYAKLKAEIEADELKLVGLTEKSTKTAKQDNDLQSRQDRLDELITKQAQERIRRQVDLENQVAQADIDAMADGEEKKRAQRELDDKKELQAIERQKEEYKRKVIQERKEIAEAQGKPFDESSAPVDTSPFDTLMTLTRSRQISDQFKANEEAMNEYYQKYGTFIQKREALENQYRQKIAEAGGADTWEGKLLQKEFEEALSALNLEELKESINWEALFGDLDKVSTEGLENLKRKLEEYVKAQKELSPENLKEVMDALNAIETETNERDPFAALSSSLSALERDTRALQEAQEAYNKALAEGTDEEKRNAADTLDAAMNAKQRSLAEATDSLHAATEEARRYMAVVSGITDMVAQLGIEPPEWLEDYLSGADKALQGLSEIELTKPMTILTGGLKAASGMIQQITSLGGLINWNGSNEKEVQATIERLTERNESLQGSIDALNDTIRQGRGSVSVRDANQQKAYQEEINRNYLEMAQAQAGYHGKRHSWNYYWESFSEEQIGRLSEQIGRQWSGDLWELSPEEMKRLKGNADMWQLIGDTGKGGYGHRLQEQLDQYIGEAGKLEEITNDLYEGLTQMSFDSMYDSFVDSLMDMEYSAEEAADNISEYFMRAMLSNKIGELYYDKLEDWWKKFGQAMENDGTLDEAERENLMNEYMGYVEDAVKLRDELAAATGYTGSGSGSSQSGKPGSFSAMSQEQGTKLEGLFTSGQMHWASMDGHLRDAVSQMAGAIDRLRNIEENTGDSARHLDEIRSDIKKIIRDGLKMK